MRPDFSIGARNGLLEQKHFDRLGSAIWLYLWFIDKQPKDSSKVLGGQPITYQMFTKQFTGVPRRTYERWVTTVRDGGYITYVRTPRGLVITITKPKKWGKSDVSKVAHQKKSDVPKMASDVPKMAHSDVPNPHIQYKSNNKEVTKSNKVSTKVLTDNRNSDVQTVIDYFETVFDLTMPRLQYQRRAAHTLIQRHGVKPVLQTIEAAYLAKAARYSPTILSLEDLRDKWNNLVNFYQKQQTNNNLEEIS